MATGKNKRPRRGSRSATESPPIPPTVADAEGFVEALDEVRATVIALLASIRPRKRCSASAAARIPAPGVLAGFNDIGALRVWADRTLRTLGVLETGQTGELSQLLKELGEFQELVEAASAQPPSPPPPSE